MPNDSIWKDSSFVGQTCLELEQDFGDGTSAAWCKSLSRGVFSDHTPLDACCVCGGGTRFEASCTNLKYSDIEEEAFTCEFLDYVPDVTEFCNKHGDITLSNSGRTMGEACCACGGGEITTGPVVDKLEYQRRLVSSGSPLLESQTLDRLIKDTARNVQGGDGDETKTENLNHNIFYHDQQELYGGFSEGKFRVDTY